MMLGRPLYRFDRASSTMDVLTELAAAGAPEGATVVAGFQEAGRGRAERRWIAPADQALLASVLLRPELALHRLMPLSILVADAIREVASAVWGLNASIKWPNDVLIGGKKVSGVLIQTRQASRPLDTETLRGGNSRSEGAGQRGSSVIVGFGINANVHPNDLPPTGTSLLAETGQTVDRDTLLHSVLDALDVRYRELLDGRLDARWVSIQPRLAMRGDLVRVEDGGREIIGTLQRIDPDGALVLRDGRGEHRVIAGDLSRGPKPIGDRDSETGKPGILP